MWRVNQVKHARKQHMVENVITAASDATDARFGIRTVLIVMTVLAVVFTALSAFIRHFPAAVQLRISIFWCVQGALVVAVIIYHMRRRYLAESKAGHVLFAPYTHSYFLPRARGVARIGIAIFLLAMSLLYWIGLSYSMAASAPNQYQLWFDPYGLCAIAGGLTCLWWQRVRLAENGIVIRSRFIPWSVCRRWFWDACNHNVAVINSEPQTHIALVVTPKERTGIETLLTRNVYVRHSYNQFKEEND
jgi:hypothetical protein